MSRILIVDPEPVIRHAIRLLMEAEGHEVVGETGSGPQALQLARRLLPDLVVMELSIHGLGGLEVIQRLVAMELGCRILVLTAQNSEYFAGRCLQSGARGFVSKQQDPRELKAAVHALLAGQNYFPSHILLGASQHSEVLQDLSVRELAVLQLLARGFSNVAISEQLAISDKTVSTYKVRLMQKLHATSLVELIDIARQQGLVEASGSEPEHQAGGPGLKQRERLEILQKLIDAMPTPLTLRDPEGRLMAYNQVYLDSIDMPREEVIGSQFSEVSRFTDPEDRRVIREAYLKAVAERKPLFIDRVVETREGRRTLSTWTKPMFDADGSLLGMFSGSEDHTEREELLRQLRHSSLQARSTERMRSHFRGAVTREIGVALRGISKTLEQVLAGTEIGEGQRDLLTAVGQIAENLQGVFADVDDFVQLDTGTLLLEPRRHDLRELIDACLPDYRTEAAAKGLDFKVRLERLQAKPVWIDALRLRQVLDNLMGNALKFTDRGEVLLRVEISESAGGQVEFVLDVEDSGPGMADEELAHLFEPFRRLPDSEHLVSGGIGFGLVLCEGLVKRMGGSIDVSSEQGVGTKVRVRLLLPVASD
nr:ATP-binding protein [uncultured Pseudomonas sp.]